MYSTISNVIPAIKISEITKQSINKHVLQRNPISGDNIKMEIQRKDLFVKQEMSSLIGIILFISAIYLSWYCNSKCNPNMNIAEKVIRAMFAGIFNIIYIILYFIAWSDVCNKC